MILYYINQFFGMCITETSFLSRYNLANSELCNFWVTAIFNHSLSQQMPTFITVNANL